MKRSTFLATAILLLPCGVLAQSPLDGTWKSDFSQGALPKEPWVYLVKDSTYECKSCRTHFSIPADGKDHPVAGSPYYDTVSMTVVDPHHFEDDRKKAGELVVRDKFEISDDGKSLTDENWDKSSGNGQPTTSKVLCKRVAAGPADSLALSGSWRMTKILESSDNGTTLTYKTEGDTLSFSNPIGQSYAVKLDGTEAPNNGDPGQDVVSVKKLSDRAYFETDKFKGKVIGTERIVISRDGQKLTIHWKDELHHNSGIAVLVKQQNAG
jgi:hypothetical protein